MKILVIRFSSIGDIVWTSPVVRCCKSQIKDSEIHFLTKSKYLSLVERNPTIDKIHLFDNNLQILIKNLKAEKYDLVIDLHNNLRSTIIKMMLGEKSYTFKKHPFQYFFYINFRLNVLPKNHVIDRFFEAIKPLGVRNDHKGIDFYIHPKDEININELYPAIKNLDYTALVIGASKYTKKMPPAKIIELCKVINSPIMLIGGNDDIEAGVFVAEYFEKNNFDRAKIMNGCGKYSISQSAHIIRQAKAVFGHDTGLTHIATAFHKKIYSIWGNTIPEFGMYPYGVDNVFIQNPNLSCRPCSKLGANSCPQKHFKCMNEISFENLGI